MSSVTYNGWTNYETWCVNLWLNQDSYFFDEMKERLDFDDEDKDEDEDDLENRREELISQAAEEIKSHIIEGNPVTEPSLYSDLLNTALKEVNWEEIAKENLEP